LARIFIVGMPGAGKSFWGEQIASSLRMPFIDLDHSIETRSNKTISDIFNEGEDVFREIEGKTLREVSMESDSFVMATGGGCPCFHENLDWMNDNGISVYLRRDLSEIVKNLDLNSDNRPLLIEESGKNLTNKLTDLYSKRIAHYEQTHIITGIEAFQNSHLFTNRLELFTNRAEIGFGIG